MASGLLVLQACGECAVWSSSASACWLLLSLLPSVSISKPSLSPCAQAGAFLICLAKWTTLQLTLEQQQVFLALGFCGSQSMSSLSKHLCTGPKKVQIRTMATSGEFHSGRLIHKTSTFVLTWQGALGSRHMEAFKHGNKVMPRASEPIGQGGRCKLYLQ